MKKIFFLTILLTSVVISGCGQQPTQSIVFDTYRMDRYTPGITYMRKNATDESIRYQAVEQGTGVGSSLIVQRFPMASTGSLQYIAKANYDQLQKKLMNFNGNGPNLQYIECENFSLTGYNIDFGYDLDETDHFVVFQYLFDHQGYLYVLSFQSSKSTGIKSIKKSVQTLRCK